MGKKQLLVTLICSGAVLLLFLLEKTHFLRVVSGRYSIFYTKSNDTNDKISHSTFNNDLDVYVRMTTGGSTIVNYYNSILVQSIKYFWPSNLSMVVVLDEENKKDHDFGKHVKKRFPFPRTCFMRKVTGADVSGKERMLRDMFYPEQCTNKRYVGFVDTDTMFVTRVTPDLLFDGDKPIVIGRYGKIDPYFDKWVKSTRNIFKAKEILHCMTYFPVVIKVKHIIQLRLYLETLHNKSFHQILTKERSYKPENNIEIAFSQFNLMCQYIWMFHRDEYTFRLQFVDTSHLSPDRKKLSYYTKELQPEQKNPFPRASVHYKYYSDWKSIETYRTVLKTGLCFSGGFVLCPDICKGIAEDSLQRDLFIFEYTAVKCDRRCLDVQRDHYKHVLYYNTSEYSAVILKSCYEVDNLAWKP